MKDEQLTALRSIELALVGPRASSASSNSSNNAHDHDSNVNGTNENVIQRRFNCTCGHSKHYVRPFVDDDVDGDLGTSWSCSEFGGEDNTDDCGNRDRDAIRADTISAIESYTASESSRRANASSASLNYTSNSRTSSEFYLSPNFPDSDHANNYFTGATPVLGNGRREEDSTDEERDIHRVHYPAQSFRPPSNIGFRNFLDAARRRMSSINGTSRSAERKKPPPHERRRTLATSTELETHDHTSVDGLPAGSNGDTPRFFADLGHSRTLQPFDVTASTCKTEAPLVEDSSGSERRSETLVSSTRGNGERSSDKRNFWRRFSLQLGHNSKDDENSEINPSLDAPPVPLQTSPPSGSPSLPAEGRPRAPSGSVLFRSFRLAGPRSPRSDGRRGAERN